MSSESNSEIKVSLTPNEQKDWWDKFKIVGTVLIAPAILIFGTIYADAIKNKESNVELLKLAVDILKEKPDNTDSNIRKWAIEIVNRHSEEKFNQETKLSLEENVILPAFHNLEFGINYNPDFGFDKAYIVVSNGLGGDVKINNVSIIKENGNRCIMSVIGNDTAVSGASSIIAFSNENNLLDCIKPKKELIENYKLNGASTKAELDLSFFGITNYSSEAVPFSVEVGFTSKGYSNKYQFKAYLNYYKEH
ncbi:hypothetical protein EU508_18965 [Pseudoalteromonas fuliginea]|uniref:Uncharacterized protein n=1 Tax=Pseudoalteromonas fuliginea TaxID=1872678 RepID=A0AB73BCE6_9GAMM|nr:hypothetical protein [Pseudoalteromonas fuliginea]KAA1157004.1 hypothetical protein EU508_18965 [Pseudoalteromonas fuliginea]